MIRCLAILLLAVVILLGCRGSGYELQRRSLALVPGENAVTFKVSGLSGTHEFGVVSQNLTTTREIAGLLDVENVRITPADEATKWTFTPFDSLSHRGLSHSVVGMFSLAFFHGEGAATVVVPLKAGADLNPVKLAAIEVVIFLSPKQSVF